MYRKKSRTFSSERLSVTLEDIDAITFGFPSQ